MRVLAARWRKGYLDYARQAGECRIRVLLWRNLARIDGLYFIRPRDARKLLSYVREIGLRGTYRKVRSRFSEGERNDKYMSCGIGQVLESDANSPYTPGTRVVLLAPCHPRCVERVVLPEVLIKPVEAPELASLGDTQRLRFVDASHPFVATRDGRWETLKAWSPFSGVRLAPEEVRALLETAEQEMAESWAAGAPPVARLLEADSPQPVHERISPEPATGSGARRAVLFGYGNYAKTVILPNLDRRIRLTKVHEIDPMQIGDAGRQPWAVDSSPWPRSDETFDVYFVAGFHDTHADISITAMERGAAVVVEKPLVTSFAQLDALEQALARGTGRFFAGYQKRYWTFTRLAMKDLGAAPGEPISYQCIVYEEPLPPLHWYRWPASRGRLVSNGCHWIDHFLFLNRFCDVVDARVWCAANGDVTVGLDLENGASFNMVMTDHGGGRLGVREHIELRTRDVTVCISGSRYVAEDARQIKRRATANRLRAYGDMYRQICERIVAGNAGDSRRSIVASTRIVLALDEELSKP